MVNAKLAILLASATAGVVGFTFLAAKAKVEQRRGIAYLTTNPACTVRQTAGAEAAERSKELLDRIDSPLARQEIEEAQKNSPRGVTEVVVELGEDQKFGGR